MKIKAIFFLSIVLYYSCTIKEEKKINEKYKVREINSLVDALPNTDSLYIFFESNFKSDNIEIVVNDSQIIKDNITTNDATGLAKMIKIGHVNDIKKLLFCINNGKVIKIDLKDNRIRFIIVSFIEENKEKIIEITYKNRINGYY